ncbi:hypothetical protein RI054_37g139560 [Pseudoscourfieldia marina]
MASSADGAGAGGGITGMESTGTGTVLPDSTGQRRVLGKARPMEGAEPARPAAAQAPQMSKHKYSSLLEEVRAYFAIRQTKGPELPDDGAVNDEARDMYELTWWRDVVKHSEFRSEDEAPHNGDFGWRRGAS